MLLQSDFAAGSPIDIMGVSIASTSILGNNASGSYVTLGTQNGVQFAFYGWMDDNTGIPFGYRASDAALMPIKDGGMTAVVSGIGTISAAGLAGEGAVSTTLSGTGTISNAALTGFKYMATVITGTGSVSADMVGSASVACTIRIGFQPSADEIADAVWNRPQSFHLTSGTFGYYLDARVSLAGGGGGATSGELEAAKDEIIAEVVKRLKLTDFLALK